MREGWFLRISLAAMLAVPLPGAVLVRLRNGSEFEALKQDLQNGVVRLSVAGGVIELAADEIASVDPLPAQASQPDSPPAADEALTVAEILDRASTTQALPAEFVRSVAWAESGLHPQAVSKKGALGLMQLMPTTAASLGVNPARPEENALGGAQYLRQLLLRYHYDARLALAAYNAGPAAVDRYHGVPPFPETIAYVKRVLNAYARLQKEKQQKAD